METGLYQNCYRFYEPNAGRYISQDPIGLLGGLNAYQYTPNPVGFVDPLGLSTKECPGSGLTGNNWDFDPSKDMDMRGMGATHIDGLAEAFKRTGVPRDQFEVTEWGVTIDGKSIPTEYSVLSGPYRGAQVNMDIPKLQTKGGSLPMGPSSPHIGYQTPGKPRTRGHIFVEGIPASRAPL